jgi:TolB protein
MVVLALIVVLAALAVGAVGRHPLPPPLGPAKNGLLATADGGQVWLRNADGSNLRALTTTTEAVIDPIWSVDGTRLAFYSFPPRGPGETCAVGARPVCDSPDLPVGSVVVVNADGGGRRVVAHELTLATGFVAPIAWSHDGTRIAFSHRAADDSRTIDVFSVGGDHLLTFAGGFDPSWSPDDRMLAYGVVGVGIFVTAADGKGSPRRVSQVPGSGFGFAGVDWSPDGTRLAFYAGGDGAHRIYVVGVDGAGERAIAPDLADQYWPIWSPDGTRLAFQHVVDSYNDDHFVVVNADGSNARELITTPLTAGPTTWSPDGHYLVGSTVTSDESGIDHLLLIDVEHPERSISISTTSGASWQRLAG